MGEFLGRITEQIKTIWTTLNRMQRILFIGAAVVIGLALFALIMYAKRVEYVVLYSKIDEAEAGKITAKLEEWKIVYRLKGGDILVPVEDRDDLRLRLAKDKLAPQGGIVTFDIFDKVKVTITDYERRINYIRALQGELTRIIESIEGVEEARVLLSMPEKKLYVEEQENATASIKLTLKPFAELESSQVKGIVFLTASAVEGLSPENVTVVDGAGNILSDFEEDSEKGALAANQLELQREEARKLERKIRTTLGRVLGPDKIEIAVKWEMNFDRREKRQEKYSMPGFEQLKVSEEIEAEKFRGEGNKPEGPPGVESNLPEYQGVIKGQGPVTFDRDERRTNYLADKDEILQIQSPDITKISVAVFVDGSYERDENGELKKEEGKPVYIPRTEEELTKYEKLVRAAIGNDKNTEYKDREYIVKIENIQFDRSAEWQMEKEAKQLAKKEGIVGYAVLGGIGLLILIILFSGFLAKRKGAKEKELTHQREMERITAMREFEERKALELSPEEQHRLDLEREVIEKAKQSPEIVANLVRTWLAEA